MTLCFGILLVGCPTAPVALPPTIVQTCPKIVRHDDKFQDALLTEYRGLPGGAKLRVVVKEWINLRDQARACSKK